MAVPRDLLPDVPANRPPREIVEFGLGWRANCRPERSRVTFSQVRRGARGISAEVLVEWFPPSMNQPQLLTVERLSLSDGKGRAALANRLQERVAEVQWRNLIDSVCAEILLKEAEGQPFETIGNRPVMLGAGWLIENIVERNQASSIYADGETGKSWIALALCVSLETGYEIIPGFRPAVKARTLYLDYETDADTMNARVLQICRAFGIDPPTIAYWSCALPFVDLYERVLTKCQREGIQLVVVDSVEAALAGARGEGADMNEAAARLNQALRRLGRSSLLIDHVSAEGARAKGLAGKAYGSVFKRNWVRLSYELKQVREPTADERRHLALYCTKRNNGPRFEPMGLQWEVNQEVSRWEAEQINDPELASGLSKADQIAVVLRDQPSSAVQISEMTGIPRGTVSATLTRRRDMFRRRGDQLWEMQTEPTPIRRVDIDGPDYEDEELPLR